VLCFSAFGATVVSVTGFFPSTVRQYAPAATIPPTAMTAIGHKGRPLVLMLRLRRIFKNTDRRALIYRR